MNQVLAGLTLSLAASVLAGLIERFRRRAESHEVNLTVSDGGRQQSISVSSSATPEEIEKILRTQLGEYRPTASVFGQEASVKLDEGVVEEVVIQRQTTLSSPTTPPSTALSPAEPLTISAETLATLISAGSDKKGKDRSRWVVPLLVAFIGAAATFGVAYYSSSKSPDCVEYAQTLLNLSNKVHNPRAFLSSGGLTFGKYTDSCGNPTVILQRLDSPNN